MSVLEKFSRVKLLAFDLDGVLTNGKLWIMPDGEWLRQMDIKDGYALQHAIKSGLQIAVITGSHSSAVGSRLKKLGITHYYENTNAKSAVLSSLTHQLGIVSEEVLFMGDDIPDIDAFNVAGCRVCPADAVQEIIEIVDYISPIKGGEGCVREVIEKVMRAKGIWHNPTHTQSI
jgi:3-deoxy-D-manno-octulosonate 8-phosphate phosphatase (KDO 8-P phosphatase)